MNMKAEVGLWIRLFIQSRPYERDFRGEHII